MEHKHSETGAVETLPRIYSHKKLSRNLPTATMHKATEEADHTNTLKRPRSHSSLHSARKTLQTCNSSKAMRLQVTTATYLKKIEMFQKQEFLLDREIQAVKEQISKLRIKRKGGDELVSTVNSRLSSNMGEEGGKAKMQSIRRRVDKQRERGKKIMVEVDKVRKQIQTTKKLNAQLAEDITKWDARLGSQLTISNQLEETLASKNQEMQKKKIEMAHQKAQIIREYDSILKKIDNQLAQSTSQHVPPSDLYLTDIAAHPATNNKKHKPLPQNSPKARKLAGQVEYFRQKMEQWKEQSECIKEKVNVKSLQQAQQKLIQVHENNYQNYTFLNQRFAHLQGLKLRNSQLNQKKHKLVQQLSQIPNPNTDKLIKERQKQIKRAQQGQANIRTKIKQFDSLYSNIKDFISELVVSTGLFLPSQQVKVPLAEQITPKNLSTFLHELLQLKQDLDITKRSNKSQKSQAKIDD